MVFSSVLFIYYFLPLFLLLYYILPRSFRNSWILIASLIFYAWGAPKFIFILIISTTLNFYLVKLLSKSEDKQFRKRILTSTIIINLGILFYFKYIIFFLSNFNGLLKYFSFSPINLPDIVLPIGISFFTFQSITYVVDVYRKVSQPQKRLWDYMMYITLFPQMIAGPIVRYNEIVKAISDRKDSETVENFVNGVIRFVIGLSKKVLLANPLGEFANNVFDGNIAEANSTYLLIGAISYSFQIYYDFAGYSDMAIGIGRMIGFKFPENFNAPYISRNISEFWRRWHITLGTFMRDYLYIPLGGNRVSSKTRLYFNLWIVFVLSGFWHGANWTFLAWGIYHGLFLVFDRMFYLKLSKKLGALSIFINYIIVLISWVIFRAESISEAGLIIQKILNLTNYGLVSINREVVITLIIAVSFAFLPAMNAFHKFMVKVHATEVSRVGKIMLVAGTVVLILLTTSSLIKSDFNPFIYFRF